MASQAAQRRKTAKRRHDQKAQSRSYNAYRAERAARVTTQAPAPAPRRRNTARAMFMLLLGALILIAALALTGGIGGYMLELMNHPARLP